MATSQPIRTDANSLVSFTSRPWRSPTFHNPEKHSWGFLEAIVDLLDGVYALFFYGPERSK
jgi:hypothetical protein